MIKALQKKFVFAAMTAISVLLVALLSAINIGNTVITAQQTDSLLSALVQGETSFTPIPPQPAPSRGSLFAPALTEDHRLSARYFVAHVGSRGQLLRVDISRIASVSEPEAASIATQALQSSKAQGRVALFRYKSLAVSNGSGSVYVFLDISNQALAVLRVLLLSIMIGLLCWGLMLLLVILLSKKAIRPIAASMERQRQFVTDAGHEIKTPLAIILANTEAMELLGGETKWSRNIREQTQRLSGLMSGLLDLSRIDEYDLEATKSLLDASAAVESSVQMFLPAVELRSFRLEKQIEPGVTVSANAELFTRLISILLDNAVKYTPQGGQISIRLSGSSHGLNLSVQNDCQMLPDCAPDKLFDRFYRADTARNQKNGGYGIGLSAARSIVEAHGGSISAQYPSEHSIVFHVKL